MKIKSSHYIGSVNYFYILIMYVYFYINVLLILHSNYYSYVSNKSWHMPTSAILVTNGDTYPFSQRRTFIWLFNSFSYASVFCLIKQSMV